MSNEENAEKSNLALSLGVVVSRIAATYFLWGWFAVPAGMHPLSVAGVTGLSYLSQVFRGGFAKPVVLTLDEDSRALVSYVVIALFGFGIHLIQSHWT